MGIHVLNKRTFDPVFHRPWIDGARIIYCGRPSILGNPFYHEKAIANWSVAGYLIKTTKVASREEAVERFRDYLHKERDLKTQVWLHLERMASVIKAEYDEEWGLMCWCAPLACHCDVIKRAIEFVNSWERAKDKEAALVKITQKEEKAQVLKMTTCIACGNPFSYQGVGKPSKCEACKGVSPKRSRDYKQKMNLENKIDTNNNEES